MRPNGPPSLQAPVQQSASVVQEVRNPPTGPLPHGLLRQVQEAPTQPQTPERHARGAAESQVAPTARLPFSHWPAEQTAPAVQVVAQTTVCPQLLVRVPQPSAQSATASWG